MAVYVIIFAVIQALTEFWPISSSAHLIIAHDFLRFDFLDNLTFDVSLHLGTAFSLIIYFWPEIVKYLRAFGKLITSWNLAKDDQKTVLNIIIASLPAFFIGYFAGDFIERNLRQLPVISAALLIGALLIFLVEHKSLKKLWYEGLSLPEAFLIGLAQTLALIPGISRSGATITAGLALNLKREEAAKFSFLLSIPVVLGAGAKQLIALDFSRLVNNELYLLLLGLLTSFLAGYFVIKYFLIFLKNRTLKVFAWYRIILSVIVFALWLYLE